MLLLTVIELKLNIGCGADEWGDIRLDVTRKPAYHHRSGRPPTVNIIADAQHLPFKKDSFEELRIHEVLEHLPNWPKAIAESIRVAEKISITVPIQSYLPKHYLTSIYAPTINNFILIFNLPKRTKEHLWQFNIKILTTYLENCGLKIEKVTVTYSPILNYFKLLKYVPLFKRSFHIIATRGKNQKNIHHTTEPKKTFKV